mmetsp:Transcript_24481/g.30522  ORF Transcript_24481/g.30522 Transcript_24481/m.30522 type:complete len:321 (-) Transcript_24481:183-1145(-)
MPPSKNKRKKKQKGAEQSGKKSRPSENLVESTEYPENKEQDTQPYASDEEQGGEFTLTQSAEFEINTQDIRSTNREHHQKVFDNLTKPQKELLVSTVTRYILFKGSKQEVIDLKKIKKEVLLVEPTLKPFVNVPVRVLLGQAQKVLVDVFGFELCPAPQKFIERHTSLRDQWFLVNQLSGGGHARDLLKPHSPKLRLLLLTVLALIFIERGPLNHARLEEKLEETDPGIVHDEEYGRIQLGMEVSKAIEQFVQQKYLERERVQDENTGEEITQYTMGVRTYTEIGKKQIVQFIFDILGETVDNSVLLGLSDDEDFADDVS